MSQLQVTGEAKIRDIQGPVVANDGVITALDGAASQYVRGDGTLADFPTSSGGGSSVSYYLNSSVSQGTIGGVAYRELSKDPIIGAGTDITISADGYVASYITDANDPDVVIVPGGNFNCEFYFSVNNNTGNPTTYAELYKYDGTTFTLLGTSSGVPESINQGTTIAPYYFAIPVATAALAVTDRLAIRIYVSVDGRTVTLHTENSHLCQVVTTLSKGMVSLNNLTDQSQFITTGTSGTNFAIVSSGDTHTFNLPVASATNTGKLSSTDWSTFNNKQAAGNYVTLDTTQTITAYKTFSSTFGTQFDYGIYSPLTSKFDQGILFLKGSTPVIFTPITTNLYSEATSNNLVIQDENSKAKLVFNNSTQTYTFPAITGTLALLEGTQTFTGAKTFSGGATFTLAGGVVGLSGGAGVNKGLAFTKGSTAASLTAGMVVATSDLNDNNIVFADNTSSAKLQFQASGTNTYTFPAASGTIALTSDLSAYVTLATAQVITGSKIFGSSVTINTAGQSILSIVSSAGNSSDITSSIGGVLKSTISTSATEFKLISAIDNILKFQSSTNFRASLIFSNTADYSYTYPNATGTIALTSNLSAYLPLSGGTLTGALTGTSVTFSGALTVNGLINNTYSDNAYLGIIIRNTNTGNQALSGFSIQNSEGTTVGQVNYVSTVYANTTLRNTLLINTVFDNKLAFATNSSGGDTRADIYFTVNPAFALNTSNPNQIHILGTSRNVAINYSGTDYGANFQVNGTTRLSDALSGTTANFSSSVTASTGLTIGTLSSGSDAILSFATNASGAPRTIYYKASTATINVTSTGGTDLMTITNGGNVGIGTSSPSATLNVNSTTSNKLTLSGGSTQNGLTLDAVASSNGFYLFNGNYGGALGFGIYNLNTGVLPFYITNDGNVGIGTTAPQGALEVVGLSYFTRSSQTTLLNPNYGGAGTHSQLQVVGNMALAFATNGDNERMRITSAGNVGIGTSSPLALLNVNGNAIVGQTSSSGNSLFIQSGWDASNKYVTKLTTDYYGVFSISSGTVAVASDPASASLSERMRITSGGALLIGTTSLLAGSSPPLVTNGASAGPSFVNADSGQQSLLLWNKGTSGNNLFIEFHTESSLTIRGSIDYNRAAGLVRYNVTSDYRLKTDFQDFNGYDLLNNIKVYDYQLKETGSRVYGVVAHELSEVLPYVVSGEKDGVKMQGVDYSLIVPILVKSIQELEARIKQLENK